ncbi:topology modulation protein [Streptomyces sp. TLI_146]|uniref:topology modulation protein n=1 Tax=Streptomyces sp. TLI_146 TaxID=1938858 RepID=UPI000C7131B0|nr:topology modulation protein [Streptomyces sp. TLI_146]PKV84233.1 adenylate kinase family enzyme [Streptomyces sp. TLI_146]
MKRIALIGCGGSGKTYLSKRIGTLINAQVTHLDAVYYDDHWNTLPPEKFAAIQEELVAAPAWVIEGNYAGTLPIRLRRADTVIFLDLPAWACLWGIAQRRLRYGGGQNDATGVYDRINWGFIRYVWGYRKSMAPRVRDLISEHATGAAVHRVTSRRQARELLDRLTKTQAA